MCCPPRVGLPIRAETVTFPIVNISMSLQVYRGQVYMIKDGGIVSCLEAASGRLLYRTRLGPRGAYFASPVAGDGKIYAASCSGVVTVLAAGDTFQVLAGNDLREPIFATPAIAAGKLYIRTQQRLYAFGPINPKP
jgi:outer membrane protein assembly factor BamB